MERRRAITLAAIAIPIVCLLLAGGVALYEWRRLSQYEAEQAMIDSNLVAVERMRLELESTPPPPHVPTAVQNTQEQPDFLNALRLYAGGAGVRITKWSNGVSTAGPSPWSSVTSSYTANGSSNGASDPSRNSPANKLHRNATPIVSSVEVAGAYNNIRQFLYDLQRSPRLLNLTDLRWSRDTRWPSTRLTFTLIRYVAPPAPQTGAMHVAEKSP